MKRKTATTRSASQTKGGKSEQGSILVMTMIITVVVMALGLTVMWVASRSQKVGANLSRRQEALYAAEAGIAYAQAFLASHIADPDGWSPYMRAADDTPPNPCAKAAWVESKGAVYLCDETGDALIQKQIFADSSVDVVNKANLTYTVYIKNDPAEWMDCDGFPAGETEECAAPPEGFGGKETDRWRATHDADNRLVIRSEGIGRDGISVVAIEVTVVKPTDITSAQSWNQSGMNAQGSNSAPTNAPAAIPLPTP
jgi:Tfp pilus assembly protein PilX